METKAAGFWTTASEPLDKDELIARAAVPTDGRLYAVEHALRAGVTVDELGTATGIDPWFLDEMALIVEARH